ncbi:hypothetical protein Bbelb_007100 [Branchiostoma belcheri]|nr:hypothetical protein Bbelb_007100 [Branchiostoma belcheri]
MGHCFRRAGKAPGLYRDREHIAAEEVENYTSTSRIQVKNKRLIPGQEKPRGKRVRGVKLGIPKSNARIKTQNNKTTGELTKFKQAWKQEPPRPRKEITTIIGKPMKHQATPGTEKLDAIVKKISSLESKVDIVYKGQKRQVKLAEEIGEEEAVNDLLSSSETLQNDIHDNPTNESSEEDSNQGPWITVTKRKTKTPALAEILKEALVEQKKVEDEQEKRKHNLIIYNVEEADQSDTRKKQDREFVESLLKVHLEVDVKVKEMYRLGRKPDTNQKRGRPLKITLENKEDRSIILNRLSKLKNAEDKIRRISVTADLSKDEREKIKELVQEAKNRTQQEVKGEWIHVVRGTYPKLQIVRKKQRKDNKLETKETKEDK